VRVPVLSRAAAVTDARASRWAPPLKRTPRRAALETAETMVAGMDMTRAHGDATTRRVIAR
jgi:hypothetical protein